MDFFPRHWVAQRAVLAPSSESLMKRRKDQSKALGTMAAPKGLSVYEHGCKCETLTMAGDDQRQLVTQEQR